MIQSDLEALDSGYECPCDYRSLSIMGRKHGSQIKATFSEVRIRQGLEQGSW
jgi:hypothetical protein